MVSVVRPYESFEVISGSSSRDRYYTFMGHAQAEAIFIGYNMITIKLYNENQEVCITYVTLLQFLPLSFE